MTMNVYVMSYAAVYISGYWYRRESPIGYSVQKYVYMAILPREN